MTLEVQFVTLFLMIGCGAALGTGFDMIGVVSQRFRLHTAVLALLDVAYWVAAVLLVFRVLFYANYGEVRLFVFIGLSIGAILYFWLLGGIVRRTLGMIITFIVGVLRFVARVVRVVLRPVVYLVRLVVRLLMQIYRISSKVAVFLKNIVIQYLVLIWKWIRKLK